MTPELYERAWANESYRVMAPGTYLVDTFIKVAEPKKGQTVRDLGCGTGRAAAAMAAVGLDVTGYDFASNCLDPAVTVPFVQHDLRKPIVGKLADFVFSTDVLEHISPDDVPAVLLNMVRAGRRVFLSIDCALDQAGPAFFGEPLHLTVQPYAWWKEQLEKLECTILWSEDHGHWCNFFVTAYANGKDFIEKSSLNVTDETICANIRANIAAGYDSVKPYMQHDYPVMIMAGGPSLLDHKDEIIERRRAGERLVTVNGTYNLALEWGLTPSMQIVCDAREFNKRFVAPPVERCRYLIASQCHPSLAASLPKDQVVLWHSGSSYPVQEEELGYKLWEDWFPIEGGGTVILRAVFLLMMLGHHKFEFYGFDSCLRHDGAHHAYSQPENDGALETQVEVGGRTFTCHPWMVCQAQDFQKLVSILGNTAEIAVHGDGLIAQILKTAADRNQS